LGSVLADDSKIPADVCLSTKKSETMKETNRIGPNRVRENIDSASAEDAGLSGIIRIWWSRLILNQGHPLLMQTW